MRSHTFHLHSMQPLHRIVLWAEGSRSPIPSGRGWLDLLLILGGALLAYFLFPAGME